MAVAVLVAVIITGETADRVAVVRQMEVGVLADRMVTAQQVKEMREEIMFTGMRLVAVVVLEGQVRMVFGIRPRQETVAMAVLG